MSNRKLGIKFGVGMNARSQMVLSGFCAALLVSACGGGGSDGIISPQELALPKPNSFVPRAQSIPAGLSEFDKHRLNSSVMAASTTDDGIIKGRGCFTPYLASPIELSNSTIQTPTKLFDDLYYIGMVKWGQYIYKTATGFVMFDSMGSAAEVDSVTLPGWQALKLDISGLKRVVVTHGHGDHDGGIQTLQQRYQVPASIGSADFVGKPYVADKLDSTILTPVNQTFDGRTVLGLSTPGHTAGTYSFVLPVTSNGVAHKVAYLGGSAHPTNAAGLQQYLQSVEAMYDLVLSSGADASINSHNFFDGSGKRMDQINAQGGYDKGVGNPMIQGNKTVALSFAALRECTAGLLGKADATAISPSWMITETDVYATAKRRSGVVSVAARVYTPYKVVAGGTVTFRSRESGKSCEAKTDVEGVATCDIPASDTPTKNVDASFARMKDGTDVNLPSVSSAIIES